MLDIKNAVKVFSPGTPNEHKALNDLSLHLDKGEYVTIVGSNGAGKSTLFNAICGNFLLDSGKIVVNDRDITFMKEHKRASFIGRVFQDPMKGTAPNMTIEENLALAYTRSHSGPFGAAVRKQDREMFMEALSEFGMGLEDRMKNKVGLLSGGQRQVVTLLMCTLVTPKLLLLDEHTAALDPKTAQKVLELTEKIIKDDKLTALMVTHNMRDALKLGNRLIMMNTGKVAVDVQAGEKEGLHVADLLKLFEKASGGRGISDRMLLS